MIPYRVKQFYWAFTSLLKKDDMELLNKYLKADEISVFMKMSRAERQHSVRVFNSAMKYIFNNEIKIDEFKLGRCALLHDIGKSHVKVGTIEKSIIIILKFITGDKILKYNKRIEDYYRHAEIGSNILSQLGENDSEIIMCIANHHKKDKDKENVYLNIISMCDDCC